MLLPAISVGDRLYQDDLTPLTNEVKGVVTEVLRWMRFKAHVSRLGAYWRVSRTGVLLCLIMLRSSP